jgi:hypothetical protein
MDADGLVSSLARAGSDLGAVPCLLVGHGRGGADLLDLGDQAPAFGGIRRLLQAVPEVFHLVPPSLPSFQISFWLSGHGPSLPPDDDLSPGRTGSDATRSAPHANCRWLIVPQVGDLGQVALVAGGTQASRAHRLRMVPSRYPSGEIRAKGRRRKRTGTTEAECQS